MGIFDIFKKKKKVIEVAPENLEQETVQFEPVDFGKLSIEERQKYLTNQCEEIRNWGRVIKLAKEEYRIVSSYFSDIQIIETQPVDVRAKITAYAKAIADLTIDRKIYKSSEQKISSTRYAQLDREGENMVRIIMELQNDEAYLQAVKRDMSALEGEKAALRYDSKVLLKKQYNIRRMTFTFMVVFAFVFGVFLMSGLVLGEEHNTLFLVVLFLAAVFAAGDTLSYRKVLYDTKLTERKINRAIMLLNKVKIKYLNTSNMIAYKYAKYDVESSYELSEHYQLYLETKKIRQAYRNATLELSEAEEKLADILVSLNLYDYKIWLTQIRALYDQKEMVEIRHSYSKRRQNLRKQVEEATAKINEAKENIKSIAMANPELSQEIFAVMERFDDGT